MTDPTQEPEFEPKPTNDFQDITKVVMTLEIDKGALRALLDDPILLTQHDESAFYANAKIRGIQALRVASEVPMAGLVPVSVAATGIPCEDPSCNAEECAACVNADGSAVVPVHETRLNDFVKHAGEIQQFYANNGVRMDGELPE